MKITLRPAIDLLDLDGWRGRLSDLSREAEHEAGHDAAARLAQTMVSILETHAQERAAERS